MKVIILAGGMPSTLTDERERFQSLRDFSSVPDTR